MGKVIGGTTLILVHQDVVRLVETKKIYLQLYGTDDGIKAVNGIAPNTFGVVQRSLQESMLFGWRALFMIKLMIAGR